MNTLYEILGVPQTATVDEIKKMYRRQARLYHPDVTSFPLAEAERMFKRVALAYEVLSNAEKRETYDRQLRTPAPRAQPHSSSYSGRESDFDTWEPGWEDLQKAQYAWDEYISAPFKVSRAIRHFYVKWEWVVGLIMIPFIFLLFRDGVERASYRMLNLMFASRDQPEGSMHPLYGMLVGAAISGLMTLTMWLHAHHDKTSSKQIGRTVHAKRSINGEAFDTLQASYVVFCFAGIVIGHYFF